MARQHVGGVYCLATDKLAGASGRSVWSGSNDFTCNMWSGDGEFVKLYAGHTGGVRSVLGTDWTLGRWVAGFVNPKGLWCVCAALGSQLWTGSDDHTIRVWDTEFGECLAVLEGHTGSVLSLMACSTEPDKRFGSGQVRRPCFINWVAVPPSEMPVCLGCADDVCVECFG